MITKMQSILTLPLYASGREVQLERESVSWRYFVLKQGSFINTKYYHLLFFNLLIWAAYGFNLMVDALVGGNQLGETALSAVSIVSPLVSIVAFTGLLFSPGYSIIIGKHIGKFEKEAAERAAGESILSAIGKSLIMVILLLLAKGMYLSFYQCTGEIYQLASVYYNWMIVYIALNPLINTLYYCVVIDGDALVTMFATGSGMAINIFLSMFLCRKCGIGGLGMATCMSVVVKGLIYSSHFFRKSNSIHFRLSWSWDNLRASFKLSYATALSKVFTALTGMVMNRVIIVSCGVEMIPVYSVINLVFSMFMTSGAAFDSCAGFCTAFMGEQNHYGITNLLKTCRKTLFGIGIALNLLFFFAAEIIPVIYGMTSPDVTEASIQACRIMAFSAIPFSFAYFAFCLYPTLGKPNLSFLLAFLLNFFCPLAAAIPLTYAFGVTGLSFGMSLSSFLIVILFVGFVLVKYGKKGFPLYLEDNGEEVIGFDLAVTKEMITVIRDKVEAEFKKRGYKIYHPALLMEELYTCILEKNPDKKVVSECTLLFGQDRARIIVRDNGRVFNFADEDNKIESLNAYVLNSLLLNIEDKKYILTTGFNRNGFVFAKHEKSEGALLCI